MITTGGDWFAWRPVRLDGGGWAFWRRLECGIRDDHGTGSWAYRVPPADLAFEPMLVDWLARAYLAAVILAGVADFAGRGLGYEPLALRTMKGG